jgi:hypothetical protein
LKFINKNTFRDKINIIGNSLEGELDNSYPHVLDMDEEFVYFEMYSDDVYDTYRLSYTFDGTSATFGDDLKKVVRTTDYKVVEDQESMIERAVRKALEKFNGKGKPVIKSFDKMEMKSVEFMYIAPDSLDLVGDTISEETNTQMVESCNKAIAEGRLEANLFHKVPAVDKDGNKLFEYTKAFIVDKESIYGDTVVSKGQALVEVQWYSEKALEMRMEGRLGAPSIGCKATVVKL